MTILFTVNLYFAVGLFLNKKTCIINRRLCRVKYVARDLLSFCCHLGVHCQQNLRIICQYGGVDSIVTHFDDFVPVDEVSSFTAMFTLVPELRQREGIMGNHEIDY
jgi:hypothetical protein